MPVLTRRPQSLTPRQLISLKPSIESHDTVGEPLWAVDEDYERPQKEMDFPLTPFGNAPSKKASTNNLRINTYTASDLHERYMESEEEPSPSPDSDTESSEDGLKHKAPAAFTTQLSDSVDYVEDSKAEIAIAVPIMVVGRPKLIDITNLAPMQRRKRTLKPMRSRSAVKTVASRIAAVTEEASPSTAKEVTKIASPEDRVPKRQDSTPMLAPSSWLPEDVNIIEEEDDHYFPDLELRNPPTYNDYDPYSLDPPCLSPRNSRNGAKKLGSVSRARNSPHSSTPVAMHNGWKGLTRSLSIAKRQTLQRGDQQITKKPKMVARAANEREDSSMIPSCPYYEKEAV